MIKQAIQAMDLLMSKSNMDYYLSSVLTDETFKGVDNYEKDWWTDISATGKTFQQRAFTEVGTEGLYLY